MKHLKTYNESLRDQMVGISDDDIIKLLDDLSDSDRIRKIILNNLPHKFLPDNLNVEGDLYCYNIDLISLPDNLKVGGDLYCEYNQLKKLPDNLIVNGDLDCSNNQLTKLPDNLKVGGELICRNNPLSKDIKKPIGVKGNFSI